MTTFRVDSDDFLMFIDWMIEKAYLPDKWTFIRQIVEKPWHWYEEYLEFQRETYEPEEPDIDEHQEWEDFDYALEVMEPMYGGDDDY